MTLRITALTSALVFTAQLAFAGAGHHEAPTMPKEFDTLKGLVGHWEGTTTHDGKEEKATVDYKLTSGGTAITETLGAGTPHEMVSVYHKDGETLGMTHYCAMGNQPHMMMKKADAKSMVFEMTKPQGVSSMKETHMHGITLTLDDPNTLTHEWQNWENGKKAQTVKFTLKRKS